MTSIRQLVENVYELMHGITMRGPADPAFDGLRVFQHPSRMEKFLTGATTEVTPLTIDLWPTIACNAHCPLCQYRLSGARMEAEQNVNEQSLDVEQTNEILLGAAAVGVRSVIFTGGGEPLMNPDIVRIVRQARIIGLRWGLVTNGTLLSPDIVHALLTEAPDFLRVSIDAGTAEKYAQVYGVRETTFHIVVKNVLAASRIAQRLRSTAMGISFTLDSNTDSYDLFSIRRLLEHIANEGEGGVRFVAFRPRLLQYKDRVAVCPQPNGERFTELPNAIKENIVQPLAAITSYDSKIDVKDGLFKLSARTQLPKRCLSGAWMTTISHKGIGYITGELAGANMCHQDWGKIWKVADFAKMWFGKIRTDLHQHLEDGTIQVPVVHRTTPVDECLQMVHNVIREPLDQVIARDLLEVLASQIWYRSLNSDFV